MKNTLERTFGASAVALAASCATLVCCVLPAVMVSIGAGAVLVGLISAVPQLVWLSEHKVLVFGTAGVMLLMSGIMLANATRLACPTEPRAAKSCLRLRRISSGLFVAALAAYVVSGVFVLATSVF